MEERRTSKISWVTKYRMQKFFRKYKKTGVFY